MRQPGPPRIQSLVGVEVEYKAVGLLDVLDACYPSMELDCSHLDTG